MAKKYVMGKGWVEYSNKKLADMKGKEFSVLEYLPDPYELVRFNTTNHPNKLIYGWYTGSGWFGLKLKKDDKVSKWRKNV